jgi:glycerol-1-phosphate dehydrogenase [NAD(P)+]
MNTDRISAALAKATDTKQVLFGSGVLAQTPQIFRDLFGDRPAVIVADTNTFAVAGRQVGTRGPDPFIFTDPGLYAEHGYVEQLETFLRSNDAIPIAVGSGTINDLVKLAAHRVGRQYLCVATAASMDGYTAFGASITYKGSKQTFSCPAPAGVVADLDIIAAAPSQLNASGYADLLAKVTAGADWILADAVHVEAVDPQAWKTVQDPLRESLSNPAGIRNGERGAVAGLMQGLLLGGFAMQAAKSSRPASGAEHQFSHLWDMQHATDASHGFKVGVATVAVARLYEAFLDYPLEELDIDSAIAGWTDREATKRQIRLSLGDTAVADKAIEETLAKYVEPEQIQEQLKTLKHIRRELRGVLREQLLSCRQLKRMLRDVGAPSTSTEIGISPQRLRDSFRQAYYIRRRFTILDVVVRAGILDELLEK